MSRDRKEGSYTGSVIAGTAVAFLLICVGICALFCMIYPPPPLSHSPLGVFFSSLPPLPPPPHPQPPAASELEGDFRRRPSTAGTP